MVDETVERLMRGGFKLLAIEALGHFIRDDDWEEITSYYGLEIQDVPIGSLFYWDPTPEGYSFWSSVTEGIRLSDHELVLKESL